MLHGYDDTVKILLRCYEYLQLRMTVVPRTLRMDNQRHREWVISFLEKLPSTAGADFIWEFLTFQFYIYDRQQQKREPQPSWFLCKEAWRRWGEYDENMKYYVKEWREGRGFRNPVKSNWKKIAAKALLKERIKMSRVAGPMFCQMKYGDHPYDEMSEACQGCPHENLCDSLFSGNHNLFQDILKDCDGSYMGFAKVLKVGR